MGVNIGQIIQLPSCNIDLVNIPGEYVLQGSNTYSGLPSALVGKSLRMTVTYINFNTSLISQRLTPVTGEQVEYIRVGSQSSGSLLHGVFSFESWWYYTGTKVS